MPLGYRIGAGGTMVPTYAPGLPLLMALARVAGVCGPFLVMPICGAMLVFFTFQLGRRLFDTGTALAGAALVACSPVMVFMSLTPMADLPAAAFWLGAMAMAIRGTATATILAAIFSGVAIVIRPNLVPLAVFPWLMTVVRCQSVAEAARRTMLFAAGSIWAPIAVAWINNLLYGSALSSGYGEVGPAFSLANAVAKHQAVPGVVAREPGTVRAPLPGLAVAPARCGPAGVPGHDRVCRQRDTPLPLLPAVRRLVVPALRAAGDTGAAASVRRHRSLGRPPHSYDVRARHGRVRALRRQRTRFSFIQAHDVLGTGYGEERYPETALYIESALPADAVIITMQHSGSIRYYTGRMIVRWDSLNPEWLDRAVAFLHDRGIATYAVLEYWEEAEFRQRFRGQQLLAELDRGPVATARAGDIAHLSAERARVGTRENAGRHRSESREDLHRHVAGLCHAARGRRLR